MKQLLKSIYIYMKRFLSKMRNLIYLCSLDHSSYIYVKMSVKWNKLSLIHYNYGDDLNVFLLEQLTGKKVLSHNEFFHLSKKNILAIGSIIQYFCDTNSIIWGSGLIEEPKSMIYKPRKICAVRGPLTKRYFDRIGVECPTIYGDPALLLPLVYSPQVEKKYKIGFIPHYVDFGLPHVEVFRKNHPEILFIDMKKYKDFTDIPNQILSCEIIVSSSLHGLILSDAYHIPNVFVQFSLKIAGGEFKYQDYFKGVGRTYHKPIDWTKSIILEQMDEVIKDYKEINFDVRKILDVCPFPIKKRFL